MVAALKHGKTLGEEISEIVYSQQLAEREFEMIYVGTCSLYLLSYNERKLSIVDFNLFILVTEAFPFHRLATNSVCTRLISVTNSFHKKRNPYFGLRHAHFQINHLGPRPPDINKDINNKTAKRKRLEVPDISDRQAFFLQGV